MAKILIVDVDVWETTLEGMVLGPTHEVKIVQVKEDGLKALEAGWPDLLILDPAHPGAGHCHQCAKSEQTGTGSIPVLCIGDWDPGGHSWDGAAPMPADASVDASMKQPIVAHDLLRTVARLLGAPEG